MKTAISISKNLFDQAEVLSCEMNLSRSRVFAVALEEFVQRRKNHDLLARINAAYKDEPDAADQRLLRGMKRHHRKVIAADGD